MYSRWFNVAVVMLWLATMSWLVKEKVLPPLLQGERPSYSDIIEDRQAKPPVGWIVQWNERRVGWALSTTQPRPDGWTRICSRVHFDELPLYEMAPGWLRALFRVLEPSHRTMEVDAWSVLTITPTGNLSQIKSSIRFEPLDEEIVMKGVVHESCLSLTVHSRDLAYNTKIPIDPEALLGDALSPVTHLPGLRKGQTWNVEVCSPLRYPNTPLEILQATVEGIEPIVWGSQPEDVWLVVYRGSPGVGLSSDKTPRGKLWVRRDGTVLKQQVAIFNSSMTFTRMTNDAAAALAEEADSRLQPRAD
jgi:hypothetical protein